MAAAQPDPREFLPLSPVVFEVLLALADGEQHGYGILQGVAGRTAGGVRLLPGSLYRALSRLLDDGVVAVAKPRSRAGAGGPGGNDERRRYYRLTSLGRRVLAAETERMAALVRAARAKRVAQPDRA